MKKDTPCKNSWQFCQGHIRGITGYESHPDKIKDMENACMFEAMYNQDCHGYTTISLVPLFVRFYKWLLIVSSRFKFNQWVSVRSSSK